VGIGEEVAITKHRRMVARLLPVQKRKTDRSPMPDIARRLQKVFGPKVIADQALRAILDQHRWSY
jgi:antitoxin (DNA-binding transcriptional repressor) of toxin-antitoxin stability system